MQRVRDTVKKMKDSTRIAPGASLCLNPICRMMIFLSHLRDSRRLGRDISRLGIFHIVF
jgi:hypothetical protein